MSGSVGGSEGSSDTTGTSNTQTNPWAAAIPGLQDILGKLTTAQGATGTTDAQKSAIAQLEANAAAGDPTAAARAAAANTALNATSNANVALGGYDDLKRQLGGYAEGQYLDPSSNPYIQKMLDTTSRNAANKVNAMFAGAGRDLSGANQAAVGTAVTNAQMPVLMQAYNDAQNKQISTAQGLANAANAATTTASNANASATGQNLQGSSLADQALSANNWGAQQTVNLEQMLKNIPLQDQAAILKILGPIAGMGGTSDTQGQSHTDTSSMNWSAGASMI
jgi:hypothetical protein